MIAALLLISNASAFELWHSDWSWQAHPLEHPIYINTGSFTPAEFGTPDELEASFEAGLEEWNGVGNLHLTSGGDTTADPHDSPGDFVVGFTFDEAPDAVIASAALHGFGGVAYDCEIWYHDRNGWGDIRWSLEEDTWRTDFAEVTTHEVGHCLGYDHSSDWNAVMRPSTRNYRGLGDDDRAAIQAIYPSCTDGDGDGFTDCDRDCEDDNAAVNPGAAEVCDGVDNNCDGAVDETAAATVSFGSATSMSAERSDTSWLGVYEIDRDTSLRSFSQHVELLDDQRVTFVLMDMTTAEVHHITEEVDAGTGFVESPALDLPLQAGHTYGIGLGVTRRAHFGYQNGGSGPADGLTPLGNHWGLTAVPGASSGVHSIHSPYQRLLLATVDLDGDGVTAQCGDCDDGDAAVRPGATEVCDGHDNDCDGTSDEGSPDSDGDGQVDCLDSTPNGDPGGSTADPAPDNESGGCGASTISLLLGALPDLLQRP